MLPDTVVAYADSTIAFPLFCEYAVGSANSRRPLKELVHRRDELVAALRREAQSRSRARPLTSSRGCFGPASWNGVIQMGTLASELSPHAAGIAGQPRVYVDANMPARLVSLMRTLLKWDVLFVMEHDDLRRAVRWPALPPRAPAAPHARHARPRLPRRSEVSAATESAGVLVLCAPNENGLAALLKRLDREVFRARAPTHRCLPFAGHKLHVHVDWRGERPAAPQGRRA